MAGGEGRGATESDESHAAVSDNPIFGFLDWHSDRLRRKLRGAVHQDRHGFFRIAFGSRPGTALVMSDKNLTVIDFEVSGFPVLDQC